VSDVEVAIDTLLALPRPLLVALDVDGTVSPIVRDPDLAAIPDQTLESLSALAGSPGIILALVTGRDLDSLARMEQLDGVWRAVEHGGLVLAPGETPTPRTLNTEQRAALERFADWAGRNAQDAFIEHKPQAIAVHVRALAEADPARAEALLAEADELASRLGLHVRRGKALREAEAVHHDKGSALRTIMARSGAGSVFFAGDDLTDLPAIELAVTHGVGAFVCSDEQRGTPPPGTVLLQSVTETAELLARLAARTAD
jgi:trehalose-phosphatase